jgi:hypothetical protein
VLRAALRAVAEKCGFYCSSYVLPAVRAAVAKLLVFVPIGESCRATALHTIVRCTYLPFFQTQQRCNRRRQLTSPACKRETRLSEVSPTSQHLLMAFLRMQSCSPGSPLSSISFHGQNTAHVVLVVVLSRAALEATLVLISAQSPPIPFSTIRSFYSHRYNRSARYPRSSRCRILQNMYSELISVSNRPLLGVAARPQPLYFLSCDVQDEVKVPKVHIYGIHRCPEVYREEQGACREYMSQRFRSHNWRTTRNQPVTVSVRATPGVAQRPIWPLITTIELRLYNNVQ